MENDNEKKVDHYDESDITVLEGLEAVRKRPGMYIGSTSERGLHHLVYEVLDNSVDEMMAGHCNHIVLRILPDNVIEVQDNGRGIPIGVNPKHGKSALEIVMTVLHAGGKFEQKGYKISGGLHGVGVSVVNALSTVLEVTVEREGGKFFQRYFKGKPEESVKRIGSSDKTGTTVRFKPDGEIFETLEYDFSTLIRRCKEFAYLNRGLRIDAYDERETPIIEEHYHFEGGIVDFIKDVTKAEGCIVEPIYMKGEADNVSVEITMTYDSNERELIYSYVNNISTSEGGTHVSGLRGSLTRAFNDVARELNIFKGKDSFTGNDVREGLVSIISVRIPEPQFEGQTKTKLGSSKVAGIVSNVVLEKLRDYFMDNPKAAKILIDRMLLSKKAREAARKAKDMILKKSGFEFSTLPGKLSDCSSNNISECEIFLVEGQSAGGTAKQGRDRRVQAILPLRGKVLNVEKAGLARALTNEEIKNMIIAFGVGIGEDFDISKRRYERVIIMSDADVDGAHIRTLILTFFYRHMPDLIKLGHVYIAQPPLYGLKHGKKITYCYDEKDLERNIQALADKSYEIQRYKGLGEMNSEQLWETTLNIETRKMLQVEIEDAMESDRIFSMLMGDIVEDRRAFIERNAIKVKNLDV